MTDYTKLVEALRCKRDDCDGCDLAFFDKDEGWMCQYVGTADAADAIEELQARLGEAENSVERWKDMYLTKHEPKRGEWIKRSEFVEDWKFDGFRCSICNWWKGDFETYNYCPKCGAKMEVQGWLNTSN